MVNKMKNQEKVLQRAFEIGWGITKSNEKSDEKIAPVLARGAMAAAKNPAVQEGAKKVVGNVVGGMVADKAGEMIGKGEGVLSPDEAMRICSAGGCVYLKDHAGTDARFYESPDYPVEDPEDLMRFIDEDPSVVILEHPRPLTME